MIIDSHVHVGTTMINPEADIPESEFISALEQSKVDAAITLSIPGASKEEAAHDEIAALAKKYPRKIYGGITLNPHTDDSYGTFRTEKQFFQEVERCVKQLKFVCIKLHPDIHYCHPLNPDARKVFQAAQDFNIPVIVHTGNGIPNSLPCLIIPRAREFPNVKIVMAHAGAYIFAMEALVVAHECPNIYLETSWSATFRIKQMIKELGAERVMFGSDMPNNISTALAQYHCMGLSAAQLEQCLSGTASEVFGLK